MGIQKFELQLRQKTMFYYLEIYSAKTRGIETTIERNFKLNSIGTELDEVFVSLLKEFNIQIPPVLSRFVKIPAISSDQKTLKMLGECIIRERFSSSVDSALVANEYVKVCEKDRNMLLAYYRAGSFLEVVEGTMMLLKPITCFLWQYRNSTLFTCHLPEITEIKYDGGCTENHH